MMNTYPNGRIPLLYKLAFKSIYHCFPTMQFGLVVSLYTQTLKNSKNPTNTLKE